MHDVSPFVLRRILALRQFPILAGAELGELAMLAENMADALFPAGAIVAPAGARPPALHLVVEGDLAGAGRTWGPRQVFGTLEILARRDLVEAVIAARQTRTLQLASSEITEVLEENFSVLRATVQGLAARLAHVLPPLPRATIPDAEPLGFVDRLIILRQQRAFAGARLEALAMLAHSSEEVIYPMGAVVARRGDPATHLSTVVDGMLHAEGRMLVAGDRISPFAAIAELPHPATIEATTRTRVLRTSASAIFDAIEDHTDLGLAMTRGFSSLLLDHAEPARAPWPSAAIARRERPSAT
jgi:CRP-like cAMP-binding protein